MLTIVSCDTCDSCDQIKQDLQPYPRSKDLGSATTRYVLPKMIISRNSIIIVFFVNQMIEKSLRIWLILGVKDTADLNRMLLKKCQSNDQKVTADLADTRCERYCGFEQNALKINQMIEKSLRIWLILGVKDTADFNRMLLKINQMIEKSLRIWLILGVKDTADLNKMLLKKCQSNDRKVTADLADTRCERYCGSEQNAAQKV
jgi:hypothetical protein